MANGVLLLQLVTGDDPASMAAKIAASPDGRSKVGAVVKMLQSQAAGIVGGHGTIRVDSSAVASSDAILGTASLTCTITDSSLVDDVDILTIGNVILEWMTSASGEGEVEIGGSDTLSGDALVSGIQGHSKLQGLFTASNAAGVVTISYVGGGRISQLLACTEVGAGQVVSAASFALDTTEAYESDTTAFGSGSI